VASGKTVLVMLSAAVGVRADMSMVVRQYVLENPLTVAGSLAAGIVGPRDLVRRRRVGSGLGVAVTTATNAANLRRIRMRGRWMALQVGAAASSARSAGDRIWDAGDAGAFNPVAGVRIGGRFVTPAAFRDLRCLTSSPAV